VLKLNVNDKSKKSFELNFGFEGQQPAPATYFGPRTNIAVFDLATGNYLENAINLTEAQQTYP
jgi:hypothetical protein